MKKTKGEKERKILRKMTLAIARITLLFTCILTLAVSNGKVAKSAMQAAVPAVSSFQPSEKSSDVPCFMMRSIIFFSSLLLPLMRVVKGARVGRCKILRINLQLIFPRVTSTRSLKTALVLLQQGIPFVLVVNKRFYVHYIQSPTRGRQEPSDVHETNGGFKAAVPWSDRDKRGVLPIASTRVWFPDGELLYTYYSPVNRNDARERRYSTWKSIGSNAAAVTFILRLDPVGLRK